MNTLTIGMPGGMTKRTLQQAVALMVGLMMLVSTSAGAQVPTLHLGKAVSIIVSKLNPSDPGPERAVQRVGGKVGKPLHIVDGFEATVPERTIGLIASQPGVRGITRNSAVHVAGQYGENSNVASAVYTDVVRASKAWGAGVTGRGVGVAVIDTGVDVSGDLGNRVAMAVDFSGENAPTTDSFGHGTFVAGLIAGNGANSNGAVKGVAPESHILSVKIAGRDGSTNIFRLLAALEWVVTMKDAYGIRVMNLSLGSDSTQSYLVDPLNYAIERVWNSGIVVVTAAGNNGKIVKPADDPLVVTVGATDDHTTVNTNNDTIASFSGVGPTLSDRLAKPDVVAPGKSVISSRSPGSYVDQSFPNAEIGSSYFKGSGTSFSSAVAAGVAALVIQKNWNLNPNQVKQRLMSTAKSVSSSNPMQQGAGQLDAWGAMQSNDTTQANQGVTPANGSGSLQGSSGSSCFRDAAGNCMSDADVYAAVGFNPTQFFGSQWAGSQWAGSQWAGSQWAGSQWGGSQWAGSQWGGSQWAGSQWAGSQWGGSQWGGSQWGGSQWAGSLWGGSQWAGSQWGGRHWAGSQWGGSQWGGSQWGGSQWAGSQWGGSQWANSQWAGSQWAGSQWDGAQWTGNQWTDLEWLGSHWG
ncbi:MAG: serine protease AprX [Acidimicrobiaceae bacterium]|nr:serine protease AprX [Acidimicrobiaceae bacterium]